MTEMEAIKELETSRDLAKMCTKNLERKREIGAYDRAIQALEEIQQYREIGTVEECQQRKDYIDTINALLKDYSDIGTIEEFKALKEKSVAKKAIKINIANTSWCKKQERYECPSCHKYLNFRELSYCCVCGQKLDWQ